MHIHEINLIVGSDERDALMQFYAQVIGLPTQWHEILVGTSRIGFSPPDAFWGLPGNPQHFAVNIPENQIEEARDWLVARVPLIEANGETIFHFENWNAHAVYFRDPVGNVVELIARHTLHNASHDPFSVNSFLCVSEIGIAADDVPQAAQLLQDRYDLPVYGVPSTTFTALGDENGLLIVVPVGREWFPHTGVIAGDGCASITLRTSLLVENHSEVKTALYSSAPPEAYVQRDILKYWDRAEQQFAQPSASRGFAKMEAMLPIVRHLRHSGIELLVRPGSQLTSFILSRAVRNGLRRDQASLSIFAWFNDLTYLTYFGGVLIRNTAVKVQHTTSDFTSSLEAEAMLVRLLMHPFD